MEECWEGNDGDVNVQPLEYHGPDMLLASAKETCERIRTVAVLHEPAFTDDCTETGESKAIDRDRGTSGFVADGWVGYVR